MQSERIDFLRSAISHWRSRSSIIYGVFLGVGSFIFACARAYLPKLFLMSVFGSIVLDVFCVSVMPTFLC